MFQDIPTYFRMIKKHEHLTRTVTNCLQQTDYYQDWQKTRHREQTAPNQTSGPLYASCDAAERPFAENKKSKKSVYVV